MDTFDHMFSNFYSHAREGRDGSCSTKENSIEHFYSHAREGRDRSMLVNIKILKISTHTPARGVTSTGKSGGTGIANFYSHAREGRDMHRGYGRANLTDFYSHAREGRDSAEMPEDMTFCDISTHTPARGVTVFL